MSLDSSQRPPLMCLTQDGLPIGHAEQAEWLCRAGARWIQLRMKSASPEVWIGTAREVVAVCRANGAICVINDSVDVALAADADGVHLNWRDEDWALARRRLGPHRILGGTVNNADDAGRATRAGCLDYAGVGPWRFTKNKRNLAPVLGADGIRSLIARLDGMPVWAIGGIEAGDLAAVRQTGATGAAVSSALFRAGRVQENFRGLSDAWAAASEEIRA